METYLKYPVVFLAAFLAALIITPVWRRIAPWLGMMDQPGGRKVHRNPVPRGGGLAVFGGFHFACAIIFLVPWKPFAGQISPGWWFRFLLVSSAVVVLGLADDRFDIKPRFKLIGQALLASAAYVLDIRVQNILGVPLPLWADYLATLFWFLVLMNSFNLIDGVDGLASGIAMISAFGIAMSLVFRKAPGDVLLFLGFAGACLGFLRYNFYPASVFLGDTGSLFIGFTLGALALSTNSKGPAMAGIGMPLLAVGVPLFDTLLAVWRRSVRHLLKKDEERLAMAGIDQGDADHLHHRLLRKGHDHSQVALLLYAFTALLAAAGILASVFHDRALGILGLTFLAAAYTVVRHLAWIELRDSGRVVLQGLTRPVRRNRTLLYYIFIDTVILNAALLISKVLLDEQDGVVDINLKVQWLKSAPTDIVLPFLVLLLFRGYSRVWYLARVSEYISAGLAVMLGSALACTIRLLTAQSASQEWQIVLYYVLFAGMAAPAVVGVRAAVRLVQDLMNWRNKGASHDGIPATRVLLCGAGYQTTLFLRQIAFRQKSGESAMDVVGIVDRDGAIRGHYVHGIRVLGNYHELPVLAAHYRVDVVYVVEDLREKEKELLLVALKDSPVRIVQWGVSETPLR